MFYRNIQKLCVLIVLAATVAFTLGGCSASNKDIEDSKAPTSTIKIVNASSVTYGNKQPGRLQSIQDKVSIQHR